MSEDSMIIEALEQSGFPFERKIRKKINELGIETFQSRYFVQNQYGEVSKDIDVLGNIILKTFKTKDKELIPHLQLRIVGEIKKWSDYKVCFYEFDEVAGNFFVSFPNFLNNCYSFGVFMGGHEILSQFYERFGKDPFSKTVCYLENKYDKGKKIGYKNNGNDILYKTSNDLALACEYFHRSSIYYRENPCISFKVHGCFPIIFTDAEIFRISGIDKPILDRVDWFFYLHACEDLDKVRLTTKGRYYLPILITNFNGIDSSISQIKKISDALLKEVEDLVINHPNGLKTEALDYKQLIESFKK